MRRTSSVEMGLIRAFAVAPSRAEALEASVRADSLAAHDSGLTPHRSMSAEGRIICTAFTSVHKARIARTEA